MDNLTCRHCLKSFQRRAYLNYHLRRQVCQKTNNNLHENGPPEVTNLNSLIGCSEEKLKLIVAIRNREIELIQLHQINKYKYPEPSSYHITTTTTNANIKPDSTTPNTNTHSNYSMNLPPRVPSPRTLPPTRRVKLQLTRHLRSFGSESCQMLSKVKVNPSLEFICETLVELIHFHPSYPQNHNLKANNEDLDYILVYFEDQWQQVYYRTLIVEFIRGNLGRLKILGHESNATILESMINQDVEEVYDLFRLTLLSQKT